MFFIENGLKLGCVPNTPFISPRQGIAGMLYGYSFQRHNPFKNRGFGRMCG